MATTESGLREGVLYEMIGRFEHRDIRAVTVNEFCQRYQVDMAQSRRVTGLCLSLFKQAASRETYAQYAQYLAWAAAMHEIGISIAHASYHKHSAYIIDHADMPGFSKPEQAMIAGILQAQRGRLGKVSPRVTGREGWLMVLCLRLSALMHRDRSHIPAPRLRLMMKTRGFDLDIGGAWLSKNPLTQANLEIEIRHWQSLGLSLKVQQVPVSQLPRQPRAIKLS